MPIQKRRKTSLSEVVVRKQRPAIDIDESASSNAPAVAGDLRPFLLRGLPEGQSLPDVALFLTVLGKVVLNDSEIMEAADEAHFDARSLAHRLLLVRDDYTSRLVPTLTDIRDTFDTAFGTDSCQRILGLGVEIPSEPLRVRRLSARLVRLLTAEDFELPPAVSDVAGVDVDKWVQELTPDLEGLQTAMDRISKARRESERTLAAKTAAVETYNESFLSCSQLLEVFYKVSGNEHLADKLRPTIPKSRSSESESEPKPPADGDGSSEEPPEQAAEDEVEQDKPTADDVPEPRVRPDRPPAELDPDAGPDPAPGRESA